MSQSKLLMSLSKSATPRRETELGINTIFNKGVLMDSGNNNYNMRLNNPSVNASAQKLFELNPSHPMSNPPMPNMTNPGSLMTSNSNGLH